MKFLKIILTTLLTLIGAISVFMTSSVLFDLFGIRKLEGNYVLLIVYANFICGLIYLYAAFTIWKHIGKSAVSLGVAALILIGTFIWFRSYIAAGGVYEQKTVYAMTFRTVFTIALFAICLLSYKIQKNSSITRN